jgi:transketolase
MEGVASEAASVAGHLKLRKLIYLYDANHVTLSASTSLTFTEDCAKRFDAYGWFVQTVEDGNDVDAVDRCLKAAYSQSERPSLIQVRTHIGYGSPHKQDTYSAHGSPLGEEEVKLTKKNLGWPLDPPFYIPDAALAHFREAVSRGRETEAAWSDGFSEYRKKYPDLAGELQRLMAGELPREWNRDIPEFPADSKGVATRVACGKVMNAVAPRLPELIGGSADLDPSTYTTLKNMGDFEPPQTQDTSADQGASGGGWNYSGRNVHFGVREHAMGAILNGLSAHGGIIPFGATFLTFSDYVRPPIRLAALMRIQVIYVFTHDSLALGEDGPTHQSVEQLASLRVIPGLIVIRPGDANETAVAFQVAVERRDRPVALALTRQNVPTLDRSLYASAEGLRRGAYVLADAKNSRPDLILLASGSEVSLAVVARQKLLEQKIDCRVVSMPSWELFDQQPAEYRESVLPPSIPARLAVEAGVSQGWCRYVGDLGDVIAVDSFGASAPGEVVMREYGFTVENVCRRALGILSKVQGPKSEVPTI